MCFFLRNTITVPFLVKAVIFNLFLGKKWFISAKTAISVVFGNGGFAVIFSCFILVP